MRWIWGLWALGTLAAPAAAQVSWCEALWIDRNSVFDRAGQCFDSPLGQALFDNDDCVPGARPLLPLDQFIVDTIRGREQEANCAVDTAQTTLGPDAAAHLDRLRVLWTVPIRADTEHACVGYSGPALDLHAGISSETPVIGRLESGQSFNFSYDQMRGGWEYILVSDAEGAHTGHGWVQNIEMSAEMCRFIAG